MNMANVRFLMQGINDDSNHRKEMMDLLMLPDSDQIILSTAFLTSDGVHLLNDSLQTVNHKIRAFIGIRNGITSKQGLEHLIKLGIETYAVDTGSSRFIFHPKACISINSYKAISIVGSANLTYGGLVNNLESSSILELDLVSNSEDKQYTKNFISIFETLKTDFPKNVLKVSSQKTVEKLFEEGKLVDEAEPLERILNIGENKKNDEVTPVMSITREKLHLPSKIKKTTIPKQRNTQVEETNPAVVLLNNKSMQLKKIWISKKLKERDLNVPTSDDTNVTGSMLLKKGMYDIDQQTYFREEAFNHLNWSINPNKKVYFEYAKAKFHFIIEGINYGSYELKLKHDTRTDTKTYQQHQPMTHLLWGAAKQLISNRSLLDKQLTLYQVFESPDEFLIEIK